MKTIKQKRGSGDCLYAVMAMATGKTLEEAKSELLPVPSGKTYLKKVIYFLAVNGYLVGYNFSSIKDDGLQFLKQEQIIINAMM